MIGKCIFKINKKYLKAATLFITILGLQASSQVFADVGENKVRIAEDLKNTDKLGDVGFGFMVGSTSGITAKFWTNDVNAFDVGVGFQNAYAAFMSDYLWHWRKAFPHSENKDLGRSFVPYLGVGFIGGFGGFGGYTNSFYQTSQNFGFGARVPIGMEYMPRSLPIGIFAELDPGVGFIPDGFTFFAANFGGRYYF